MWPTQVVMKNRSIPAAKFKANCLSLLDEVARSRAELVVTRRGTPIARVVPLERPTRRAKLKIRFIGDVVGPSEPEWND
ncbi:MAG: type II toxin-antitoxin system Phd/YefM family antitoxin [Archangium sp.]|nr:type II toxin-antitoxin system Phd/YefM family antitoxin [Archangium sp.]